MPTNPYDDAFRNLAKVMEELLNNLSLDENPRFVGCTIITGPGEDPRIIQFDTDEENDEIAYELIESDDCIYITADIPPSLANEPYADIQADRGAALARQHRKKPLRRAKRHHGHRVPQTTLIRNPPQAHRHHPPLFAHKAAMRRQTAVAVPRERQIPSAR
jgi:hypothetical protein